MITQRLEGFLYLHQASTSFDDSDSKPGIIVMGPLLRFLFPLVWVASCLTMAQAQVDDRPNILLLVADDLGYSDLGSYGGEIDTPNIDALVAQGLRFTGFRTAPMCAPTRAMLLSGNNNHVAGMGRQGVHVEGAQGYEPHLSDRIVPFPLLLRDAGYETFAVGKWHLGKAKEHSPAANGFERSYNLLQGAGNHYNSIGLEAVDSVSLYREDGELTEYPDHTESLT